MNKRVLDKFRKAANTAKKTFFKPKPSQADGVDPQSSEEPQEREDMKNYASRASQKLKSFAIMTQDKLKSMNSSQLDYMKSKLNKLSPKDRLKSLDLKDSLKEEVEKLKKSSEKMLDGLKDQASKLGGTKKYLSSAFNKIARQEEGKEAKNKLQTIEDKPKQEGRDETRQEKVLKWFDRQVHNSEANWKTLQKMIQHKIRSNSFSKFSLIQRVFQKLYWKTLILVCFIVFAYGLGTSIPREVRKAWENADRSKEAKA